ncbi:nitroreductase family protein [Rhizobium helianthi]|uniref:Nitroreductase family protein n=1 Tax=Rhizobium helianthi TaxID=1132695 RepID=A0ABW4M676_9HYPH
MTANTRKADHPVAEFFPGRWSPRAFTDAEMSEQDLLTILEAARWAPSAFNAQPWRFVYSLRNDESWDAILGALVPANQSWAKNASALVVVASQTHSVPPGKTEPVENGTHAFDTGAAWGYLALQAHISGFAAHAMAGFDTLAMAQAVGLPEGYVLHATVAVGQQGDPASLPEALQARELASPRHPLALRAFHGKFKASV